MILWQEISHSATALPEGQNITKRPHCTCQELSKLHFRNFDDGSHFVSRDDEQVSVWISSRWRHTHFVISCPPGRGS